jgi:16S rRNA (adenine1518-N6/adenine1519-N6)-dimethyltransferase
MLRSLEQGARRRFGQNFLVDPSVADRIVRGAQVKPGDKVVEIGPGLGLLTEALVRAGAEVTAVELDRDLAAHIRSTFPEVTVVQDDGMRVDWSVLCPGSGWKVVANLPYNVGTSMLMQLVRIPATFHSVTVMLQREVVQRILAGAGSRTYGALSVEVQVRGVPLLVFGLGPEDFHPRPKVHSSVVRVDLHPAPEIGSVEPAWFDRVVRAAFSQRRKKLANSLAPQFGKERARDAITKLGTRADIRAEHLDRAGFVTLAEALAATR